MTYARPMFPPPAGRDYIDSYDPAARAARDGHPLAGLILLRQLAAEQVERLLAFLDETDGCEEYGDDERELDLADEEPSLGWTADGQKGCDDEREFDEVAA